MSSSVAGDRAQPKMIANGKKSRQDMPTPNTLARIEDPRAWHARGEAGIQRPKPVHGGSEAITLPMAPPLPKGRAVPVKKVVLEEEEYIERLGDIIEEDYFPHNSKMHSALLGLTQGTPGDVTGNGGSTPSRRAFMGTPSSSEVSTPVVSTPGLGGTGSSGEGRGGKPAGTGGALTKFVAMHTSEDNQAFAELQEKDQEAFRRRYFWAYDTVDGEGNNATSTKLLILPDGKMMSVERREQMDAACADRPKIGDDRPNQVETWKHRTRNQLMFSPNLAASNDTCRIEQQPPPTASLLLENGVSSKSRTKRQLIKQTGEPGTSGQVAIAWDTIKSKDEGAGKEENESQSALLVPTATRDKVNTVDQTRMDISSVVALTRKEEGRGGSVEPTLDPDDESGSQSPKPQGKEPIEDQCTLSRAPVVVKTNPKIIQAHATRFPVPAPLPRRRGPWASPIEKPSSSRESVAGLLAAGTNVSDYAEVPMTPSRVPGMDGDSPLVTWGSIDGTPMILDPRATPLPGGSLAETVDVASIVGTLGGSLGGQQFEMKDLPPRDKLAHRLEAVDTRRKRTKVGSTPGGRGTRAPTSITTTPLTPRTPGSRKRTPGTGRLKSRRNAAEASRAASLTPAARTLAARLAQRRGVETPFGGGLTPGRQKKRSGSKSGGMVKGDGLTPLPSTPAAGGKTESATPVRGKGKLRSEGGKQSSLTDGLLTMK